MAKHRPAAPARRLTFGAALALLALAAPLPSADGGSLGGEAQARAPRGPQQIGGTWVATWQNSRGESRKGLIVIGQRGTQLTARIESHGNVTATGALQGSTFTLRGTRTGVPFTVTGNVQGKKMGGLLSALFVERRFTARKRGR